MREILLVRHGKAAEHAMGGDAMRPLTDDGKRVVEAVGRGLLGLGLVPDAIWHSPFLRATETATLLAAALFAAGLGGRALKPEGALTPGSDPERAARLLLDAPQQRVMAVSHMPLLPAVAVELVGARVEFGTATVAHVVALGPHGSTLAGLWSADVLSRLR